MSHACGTGEMVPEEIIRLMLLLKVQSLSYGNSGVQVVTVQRLIDFFNNDVLPVVYNQGSLGASGDLAPLANLMLPLLGLGEVHYQGKIVPAEKVLKKFKWEPITLQSKEGLALLNGTQFMSSYAVRSLLKAMRLSRQADMVLSLSLDAFDGRIEPFYENRLNNPFHIIKYYLVIKSQYSNPILRQKPTSHLIIFVCVRCLMHPSIQFYPKPNFRAIEVYHIWPNTKLSSKLQAIDLFAFQRTPKDSFG